MMTRRLWRAFKRPPVNDPLYQRQVSGPGDEWAGRATDAQSLFIQGVVWLWPLVFVVDARLMLLMALSGTIYGAAWAFSISGAAAGERERRRYDLLCLTPGGAIGSNWALCTASLHRDSTLAVITSRETWIVRCLLLIPLVMSFNMLFGQVMRLSGFTLLLATATLIGIFYLDQIQSIILGSLFGMLVPHYTRNSTDARILAAAGFLALQTGTYLALALVALISVPTLLTAVPGARGLMELIALPAGVGVYYFVREKAIVWTWSAVTQTFNSSPDEAQSVIRA